MSIQKLIFLMIFSPLLASCMDGDYEQIALKSWEEGQTFKLNAPKKVEKMTKDDTKEEIVLKIDGEFTHEDRVYAFNDESCIVSISSVHAVHRDHVVLNVPSHFENKGEVYLMNMRGGHSTDCTKLKID